MIAHIEANCDQKQKEQIAARRCCYKKCKVKYSSPPPHLFAISDMFNHF